MKHNPDDRSDNAEKIQENINSTLNNIELANNMIDTTSDKKMKQTLEAKNERREQALHSLNSELKDETNTK